MITLKFSGAALVALSILSASCASWAATPVPGINICGKKVETFEFARADGTTIPPNTDAGVAAVYRNIHGSARGQAITLYCDDDGIEFPANLNNCTYNSSTQEPSCTP